MLEKCSMGGDGTYFFKIIKVSICLKLYLCSCLNVEAWCGRSKRECFLKLPLELPELLVNTQIQESDLRDLDVIF